MSQLTLIKENQTLTSAQQRIEVFRQRFDDPHLHLACHAALPIALTPELVYGLWANFQTDDQGQLLEIPWEAVSDFLLSELCDEVGRELYEIEQTVREALIERLQKNRGFGDQRVRQIAHFLESYAHPKLSSENPDDRDFSQAQNWAALAYIEPEKAAQELKLALSHAIVNDPADLVRLASLVEYLRHPFADYPDLLTYARGILEFACGDLEKATQHFNQISKLEKNSQFVSNVNFPSFYKHSSETQSNVRNPYTKSLKANGRETNISSQSLWRYVWPQGAAYILASLLTILTLTKFLDFYSSWLLPTREDKHTTNDSETLDTSDLEQFGNHEINSNATESDETNIFDSNPKLKSSNQGPTLGLSYFPNGQLLPPTSLIPAEIQQTGNELLKANESVGATGSTDTTSTSSISASTGIETNLLSQPQSIAHVAGETRLPLSHSRDNRDSSSNPNYESNGEDQLSPQNGSHQGGQIISSKPDKNFSGENISIDAQLHVAAPPYLESYSPPSQGQVVSPDLPILPDSDEYLPNPPAEEALLNAAPLSPEPYSPPSQGQVVSSDLPILPDSDEYLPSPPADETRRLAADPLPPEPYSPPSQGQVVSPDLPILPDSDEYLPNSDEYLPNLPAEEALLYAAPLSPETYSPPSQGQVVSPNMPILPDSEYLPDPNGKPLEPAAGGGR